MHPYWIEKIEEHRKMTVSTFWIVMFLIVLLPLLIMMSSDIYIVIGIVSFAAAGLRVYWTSKKTTPVTARASHSANSASAASREELSNQQARADMPFSTSAREMSPAPEPKNEAFDFTVGNNSINSGEHGISFTKALEPAQPLSTGISSPVPQLFPEERAMSSIGSQNPELMPELMPDMKPDIMPDIISGLESKTGFSDNVDADAGLQTGSESSHVAELPESFRSHTVSRMKLNRRSTNQRKKALT